MVSWGECQSSWELGHSLLAKRAGQAMLRRALPRDYVERISMKLMKLEDKSQSTGATNSLPSKSAGSNQNPLDPALNSMQSQVRNQGKLLSISLAKQSQAQQPLLSQSVQNPTAFAGVQNSASLSFVLLPSVTELLGIGLSPRPNTFSYAELRNATEDFNPENKLGEGGFGPVYKRLNRERDFVAEIATIFAVQHRNLVKLYGFCIEGDKKLLVYEYLENGSLDQALFGTNL
ncbi:hypothetical protein HHK36_017908 [Tetracentron sinense]|uniref:Protein kinase domain-containing protein n=1 Tax=Tetracentron sinense TaxID=13715 RepID=A0A834Z3P5_TETSI|nr:hypothetical protein HHK36_017908 [Tetracentron sinense]